MNTNELDDDDRVLPAAEMLALLKEQQRSVESQKGGFVPLILLAWGVAWLVGFGALWLVDGLGDSFSLPIAVAAPIFVVLLIAAGALSAFLGIRSSRGMRGSREGAFVGILYGQSWWVGSIAIYVIGMALVHNGMDRDLLSIFYPSVFIFFAGLMYIMAAALWRALPMLFLGLWSIVVCCAAPFFGQPTHYLVYALAGGGAFLIAGGVSAIWIRRGRRRLAGAPRS